MLYKNNLKEINHLIGYYFNLPKGHHISYPNMKMFFGDDIRISRRSIKHIVETRKEDKYDLEKISIIFSKIPDTIKKPDFSIKNWNNKYPRSFVSVKLYFELDQVLLVVHDSKGLIINVINAFFRETRKYKKIKAKSQ